MERDFDAIEIVRKAGQPVCAALFAAFGFLAGKKKPIPLLALLAVHISEYFIKARNVALDYGINRVEAFFKCLAFGFTWWLPISKDSDYDW